jgi:hypothetical protein
VRASPSCTRWLARDDAERIRHIGDLSRGSGYVAVTIRDHARRSPAARAAPCADEQGASSRRGITAAKQALLFIRYSRQDAEKVSDFGSTAKKEPVSWNRRQK